MKMIKTFMIISILLMGGNYLVWGELVTPNPTAIQEIDQDNIIAYPIPASTIIHFAYRAPSDNPISIKIFNTRYKMVKELTSENLSGVGQLSWDVSHIAPGIYFYYTAMGEETIAVKRLVIAR